jgi:hypothetical protein
MDKPENPNFKLSKPSSENNVVPYDVGYQKPPMHSRFQKGASGNKKGRPKGAKNKIKEAGLMDITDLILAEAYREVTIHEGEKSQTLPIIQAALRSLTMNAAKGKHYSQKLLIELLGNTESERKSQKFSLMETAIDYKQDWGKVIKHAETNNLPIPDPVPHPNHIIIDPNTGDVRFTGPMTEEKKKEWDIWVARILTWQKETKELELELVDCNDPKIEVLVKDDITHCKDLIDIARRYIPEDIFIPPSTWEFYKSGPDLTLK